MNEILLKSPDGKETNFNNQKGKVMDKNRENMSPVNRLLYALHDGELDYAPKPPFYDVLKRISDKPFPCEELAARSLYCGQLWADLGDLIEANKDKSPELMALYQAVEDYRICYDVFFDGMIQKLKPVGFEFGKKGEFKEYHTDEDAPNAKKYWYFAFDDAKREITKLISNKVPQDKLKVFLDGIDADKPSRIEIDKDTELVCKPCFREKLRTKRFSGNGKPDDKKDAA